MTARKITILLAEDDQEASAVLGAMLTHSGYNVTYANDGEETLRAVDTNPVDIILVDIGMPNLSGGETARTLTGYKKSNIPMIAVTAEKMTPGSLADLGISDCEQKPINFPTLLQKILRVLATRITPAFA